MHGVKRILPAVLHLVPGWDPHILICAAVPLLRAVEHRAAVEADIVRGVSVPGAVDMYFSTVEAQAALLHMDGLPALACQIKAPVPLKDQRNFAVNCLAEAAVHTVDRTVRELNIEPVSAERHNGGTACAVDVRAFHNQTNVARAGINKHRSPHTAGQRVGARLTDDHPAIHATAHAVLMFHLGGEGRLVHRVLLFRGRADTHRAGQERQGQPAYGCKLNK